MSPKPVEQADLGNFKDKVSNYIIYFNFITILCNLFSYFLN